MKLTMTANEVKMVKGLLGEKSGFSTHSTKVGHEKFNEDGSFEVVLNTEFVSDFLTILVKAKPAIVAIVAMMESLSTQLADLGNQFNEKWFK